MLGSRNKVCPVEQGDGPALPASMPTLHISDPFVETIHPIHHILSVPPDPKHHRTESGVSAAKKSSRDAQRDRQRRNTVLLRQRFSSVDQAASSRTSLADGEFGPRFGPARFLNGHTDVFMIADTATRHHGGENPKTKERVDNRTDVDKLTDYLVLLAKYDNDPSHHSQTLIARALLHSSSRQTIPIVHWPSIALLHCSRRISVEVCIFQHTELTTDIWRHIASAVQPVEGGAIRQADRCQVNVPIA